MLELIYTSAPRLLEAGKTGFGTLRCSKGMPRPLISYLERISAFDRSSGVDALEYYTFFKMGGVLFHVFSRAGDCGADYTGRTNHIAHHFVVEEGTPEADGLLKGQTPASVLMGLEGLWVTSCPSAPGHPEVRFPYISSPDSATSAWEKLTGTREKARWMGLPPYSAECCLMIPEVARPSLCLQLLHEGYVCKQNNGWGCGFATACTGTLGANLVPVTCLDARQSAAGVNPGRATPVLEVTNALVIPPESPAHAEEQDFAPPIPVVEQPPPEWLSPSIEQLPSAFSIPSQTPVSVPTNSPPRKAPVGGPKESDHVSFAIKVAAALVVLAAIFFIFRPGKEERLAQPEDSKPDVSGIPEKQPSGEKQSTPAGPSSKKSEKSGRPSVEAREEEPVSHEGEKSDGREREGETKTSSDAPMRPPASGGDRESASGTPLPEDASSTALATSTDKTTGMGKGDAVCGEGTATGPDAPSSPHGGGQSDNENGQGTHGTSPSDTQSSPSVQDQRSESVGYPSKSLSLRDGDKGVQVKVTTKWEKQEGLFNVTVSITVNKKALMEKGYSEGWEIYYDSNLWPEQEQFLITNSFKESNQDMKDSMKELSEAKKCMKKAAEDYDGKVERNETETTKVSETLQSALKDPKKWEKDIGSLKEKLKVETKGERSNEPPSDEKANIGGKEQDRETGKKNLCCQLLECIKRYEQALEKKEKTREAVKKDYKESVSIILPVSVCDEEGRKNVAVVPYGLWRIIKRKGKEEHEQEKHE